MTSDDDHPFDPATTPCPEMGVVADTFWRRPTALRSNSPHAFTAEGPLASYITAPHPVEPPHGLESPPGRVHDSHGQVLLLGVGHQANTIMHVAENIAGVRYFRTGHVTVVQNGRPRKVEYREVDHCCELFAFMDAWLDQEGLQNHGVVGNGKARLANARDIVGTAVKRLREQETVFLHPAGVDADCDEARASLDRPSPDGPR